MATSAPPSSTWQIPWATRRSEHLQCLRGRLEVRSGRKRAPKPNGTMGLGREPLGKCHVWRVQLSEDGT